MAEARPARRWGTVATVDGGSNQVSQRDTIAYPIAENFNLSSVQFT